MAQLAQKCSQYKRRRSEETPLYQIIQASLNTFIHNREQEGSPLPEYVLKEFDAYLKCGLFQFGFLRLQCQSCQKEKIVAFSCKKRGFCPSCCAKRMAEAAAHLVDNVLPMVPYRQFVLSFPIPLRYWMNANKKLESKIHKIVTCEIHGYYKKKATEAGITEPIPGSITFMQRFGSDLRLNPHYHILCLDGVYTKVAGKPLFSNLQKITDDEAAQLAQAISENVRKHLRRKGYLSPDGELVENPMVDEFLKNDSLNQAVMGSVAGRITFGPGAGRYVTRIGHGFGYEQETPLAKGKRCYSVNGFSLHCNTAINTLNRRRLEKLVSYIARGPLSNERLQLQGEDCVILKLKSAYSDGTTHLRFTYEEFLEKLVALIPRPRSHLVRWSGCMAPNSPSRKHITLKPSLKKGFQFDDDEEALPKKTNHSWAKMLARVFKIDVTICEACGGELKAVAALISPVEVRRYLRHMGLDSDPPVVKPAVVRQGSFDFDQSTEPTDSLPTLVYS